jgi:hypothetical protein
VLNAGSLVQCHSLEDGSFKSDHTVIGAGATIGVDTFVHYGVTMGEGSLLETDAFLMKGESMAPFAIWRGNPATEVRVVATPTAAPTAAPTVPLRIVQSPPAQQARPAAAPPTPRPVRAHAAVVRPGHVPFIDFLAGAGTEGGNAQARGPVMRRDDVLTNLATRGEQIAGRLAGLAHHPAVRQVRGAGLMWEIELNAPRDGRTATELAEEVRSRALHGGLIVGLGGRDGRVVRMLPALDVPAEVVDMAMSILLFAIEGAHVGALKAG